MATKGLPAFRTALPRFLETQGPDTTSDTWHAAIFGAPLDLTTSFRQGTDQGPAGVREMSWALETYSPILDRDTLDLRVIDLGDLPIAGSDMEEALQTIADAVEWAARRAQLPIMIGGEHTASLGAYRGITRVHPGAWLLQVDAHLDLRDAYEGVALTHASWVYHAALDFGYERIVQLGVRSGEREEWKRARGRIAHSSRDLVLPPEIRSRMQGQPLYVTLDIDVLDPAHAPGTGCPEPGGCTFRELQDLLYSLEGLRVVGLDVVEVAPPLDHSGITSAAAAHVIREAILLFGGAV